MPKTLQEFSNLLPTLKENELAELEQVLSLKAKQKLTRDELDDYLTWVNAVWVTARGEPLDFESHKYLKDIYHDQHPNIIFQKAGQMGLSERLISEAVWVCDRLSKNVLFVFPTSNQLSDFVQARLEPVFNLSDYLSRITGVLSADEKREKQVDMARKIQKVGLKQIGSAFLYLRGSQNQQQIISVDADLIILDERDRFIQEHVSYIDKRLLHSTLRWRREASTPTYPGKGINESYLASDQRVWMVVCPKCKEEQELDFFFNVDFEKQTTICRYCKKPVDRLQEGRWIAQNPTSAIHGYKISGIYNPQRTVGDLIEMFEKAKNSGFSAMQQFYNQVLGLPYEAEGKTLLLTELDNCVKNYTVPEQALDCYGGADVGAKIHAIISKKINGILRYVWIGTVSDFFGPADSLEVLMNMYNVGMIVIDAAPETRKVREFIEKFPRRVFAAYYPTRRFDVQNYYTFDEFRAEVYIDKTISLDYLVSEIQSERIELPSNGKYIAGFYEQMTASIRVTETNPRTGQPQTRWIEKGPDHYCFVKGTEIQTLRGLVPIERVVLSDYVLTRKGFKKVSQIWLTEKRVKVIKVKFSNGKELIGTSNHKIWIVGKDFVELHSTNYGDTIVVCNSLKVLFFKGLSIGGILIQKIVQIGSILHQMDQNGRKVVNDIIKNYGNPFMEKFQKDMQFIIKTEILSIITSPILNACHGQNTNPIMLKHYLKTQNLEKETENTWMKLESYPMHGDGPKKGKNGIVNMPSKVSFCLALAHSYVSNVAKQIKQRLVAVVNSVQADVTIVSKQKYGEEDRVWNLGIESCHEYYANGILVSNCHAANYNRIASLKGSVGQTLLENYKTPNNDKKDFAPNSLAGWANLVRLKGVRF